MTDLISRADALALFYPDTQYWGDDIDNKLLSLPSAEVPSDLISKAEVLETYADLYQEFDDNPYICKELHKVYDRINALPSADADAYTRITGLMPDAVQGEWVKDYEKNIYKCSVCGCEEVVPTCMGEPTIWKYCPNCGSAISARMKGGAE